MCLDAQSRTTVRKETFVSFQRQIGRIYDAGRGAAIAPTFDFLIL
jgi:hypothetical protein